MPAATAVTTPVEEFTVATPVLSLLHAPVPPPNTTEPTVYVVVDPIHCGVVPAVTVPALAVGVTVRVTETPEVPLHPVVVFLETAV